MSVIVALLLAGMVLQEDDPRREITRRLACQTLAATLASPFSMPDKPSALRLKAYKDGQAITSLPTWGDAWPKGTNTMFAKALPDEAARLKVQSEIFAQVDGVSEVERIGRFNACLATYPRP